MTNNEMDARIASRIRGAVINNCDDDFRVLAFMNRHLIVAALDAFTRSRATQPESTSHE